MRQKLMKKNNLYYSEWHTSGPRLSNEKVMRKLLNAKEVVEVTY